MVPTAPASLSPVARPGDMNTTAFAMRVRLPESVVRQAVAIGIVTPRRRGHKYVFGEEHVEPLFAGLKSRGLIPAAFPVPHAAAV